ncbi:hypothetical protein BJY01DRAFT_262691 [Aspergillus pseudoustus]|uniref:Transcription factor domain-containing protein n=1 Tax=Aspergillus pseudoustus TaxID=1810923 RepID=A0ABR4K7W3_9EURO
MGSLPSLRPKHQDPDNTLRLQSRVILPPRRKTSLACTNCRAKKTRVRSSSASRCCYENTDKRKNETWRSTISDLELKNGQLERIIESLKCNSLPEAVERLQQLRGDLPTPSQSLGQTVTPTSSESSAYGPGLAAATYQLPLTPSSRPSFSRSVSSEPLVDLGYVNLPTEEMTRHAISSFMRCGSTLFHVMSKQSSEDLIDKIYRERVGVTSSDICQLCALAAVGSQYCTNEIPAFATEIYYLHASSLFENSDGDDLIYMRVFACLSVYLILLKSTSARTMTDRLEWARVYRTLAFTECWLSSTLGYECGLWPEEIQLIDDLADSETAINPDNQICTRLIQRHVFKIALLSARVCHDLGSTKSLSMDDLQNLSDKLDTWHQELPESIHLSSLTSPNSGTSDSARRPLLFMHMIHISSHLSIFERVMRIALKEALGKSDKLMIQKVFSLPTDLLETYGSFAQQLARIIKLLYDEECVLARCWLTIHASFHAAVVLLMRATKHLALGAPQASVLHDLEHFRVCLQVLHFCEKYDIAAMRLIDVVGPLAARVRQTIENPCDANNVAPTFSISETSDGPRISAPLAHVVHQLVGAMGMRYQEIWV